MKGVERYMKRLCKLFSQELVKVSMIGREVLNCSTGHPVPRILSISLKRWCYRDIDSVDLCQNSIFLELDQEDIQ